MASQADSSAHADDDYSATLAIVREPRRASEIIEMVHQLDEAVDSPAPE